VPKRTGSGLLLVTDLYACRGRVRSLEIVDAFLAPSSTERIAQHRRASFAAAGQLEEEVVFGLSPADAFGRIERTFRGGECVLETTYGRDGAIALRRRTTLDSTGRPIEEIVEDSGGRRVDGKTIRYDSDGSRIEEMQQVPEAGHFQIAGIHFPMQGAASIQLHYDERGSLRRARFLGEDGASVGDVVIQYDAGDRRRSVRHSVGDDVLSEVRFEYDDAARTETRTTLILGSVTSRSTSDQHERAAPTEGFVDEDELNETGDWIERRTLERQDEQWIARRVIRRAITYW
jgi:hypothetical protein